MQVTLYVGGLSSKCDEKQLSSLFDSYGELSETRLIMDPDGSCRGFAYVTFMDDLCAAKARVALNGKSVDGQVLRVAVAT